MAILGAGLKKNRDSHPKISGNASILPLDQCLAKTWKQPDGENRPGRLVLSHCTIVGMVAKALIHQMPDWLSENIFPENSHIIAAAHDIGKVSPTFQKKIYTNLTTENAGVLEKLSSYNEKVEKHWGGHAGVSQLTAKSLNIGEYIPEILGQHHGFSSDCYSDFHLYSANSAVFGGEPWNAARKDLLNQLIINLGCKNMLWPTVRDPLQAMILSGLTTVSDWIGSGPLFENPSCVENDALIQKAIMEAGFVTPSIRSNLSFQDIFGFPANSIQIKMAENVQQKGVYVLEAPMGVGKTEAALFAAYQMLEQKKATGIYFALPTQLTSDKIHERVNLFLQAILSEDSPHRSALIIHGNSHLKTVNTVMGEEANPGGAWFSQSKRGILAPFAVGTIDQALMAVMNVKHGFVRTFGLAGKVVILDEVHSYDSYTGTIMDTLISALQKMHCTVIILSATLTQSRRNQMIGHFDNLNNANKEIILGGKSDYPLLTSFCDGTYQELPLDYLSEKKISVCITEDDIAINEALSRAESGQQVLWIENTIAMSQSIYKKLAARAAEIKNVDCGLLHSGFTRSDRSMNESIWVNHFGKEGFTHRNDIGRILVGTQVLEQSIDIDADFLITRLAPTDMMLQRMGRLWRHSGTVRPINAHCEAWILSPFITEMKDNIEKSFGSNAKVYAPYVLYRSLEVWNKRTEILIPNQLRELIELTYIDREEKNPSIQNCFHQLDKKIKSLKQFALIGLSRGGKTWSEEEAKTRYSELETIQVLLLRDYKDEGNNNKVVEFMDGSTLLVPKNGRSLSRDKWINVSHKLMQNIVHVKSYQAPLPMERSEMSWLGDYFYIGNPDYDDKNVPLRIGIVSQDGIIHHPHHRKNNYYRMSYHSLIGYTTEKLK